MNRIEFDEWLDYHGLHNYEFASFVAKQAETDEHYHERQLKAWRDNLYDVSLESAKDVSLLMGKGKTEEPKGPGDAVRLVAKLAQKADQEKARNLRPVMVDGEYAARCPTCRDGGLVDVVAYRTIRVLLDTGVLLGATDCSVACTCLAGNSRAERGLQRYDPGTMPRWPSPLLDWSQQDWAAMPERTTAAAVLEAREAFLRGWLAERGHRVPDSPPAPEPEPAAVEPEEFADLEPEYAIPDATETDQEEADDLPF